MPRASASRSTGQTWKRGAKTQSARSAVKKRASGPPVETSGIVFPPKSNDRGPALYFGLADSTKVRSVDVVAERENGEEPIDSNLIEVRGEALAAAGGRFPVTVFTAELSRDLIQAAKAGDRRITATARDNTDAVVDTSTALIPGLKDEVALQQGLIGGRLPREIEREPALDAERLTRDETEPLKQPGRDGATLADAINRFESEPPIAQLNEGRSSDRRFDPGDPSKLPLLLQTGVLRTDDGEIAYFVLSRSYEPNVAYLGVYSADDLTQTFFGEAR